NQLDRAALEQLAGWAHSLTVVTIDDEAAGFLVCLSGPGLPYQSHNYQWLSRRYDSFLYVDRVVVAPDHKGAGAGQALYRWVARRGRGSYPVLVAEVNTRPRNEASLRFHERFGFRPVGRADTDNGTKTVLYLELDLALAIR
ncbi:MAG: GNAT family N-acetyltransferase, partial [Acidimicrobiia bacterium]|nr:GNAT family N-acetyltransferase [Acidimicrobiia bacterium]